VALHQSRPRFYEERWKIYSTLRGLKALDAGADFDNDGRLATATVG
jgi:hypothetical protein